MFVTQAQPLKRRSVTQLTSSFLDDDNDDDDDRCSMGTKNVYIHEHEQFNLLIRFSILTKLMSRIERARTNERMFGRNVLISWAIWTISICDVSDWKLIAEKKTMNDDCCLSSFLSFLEHWSQEVASYTAKLLLENQLKYPSLLLSCQLELSFAFTFIHLPTGGSGRKSNDVRLIGIVIAKSQ